ncbi:hypothetical protein DFH08DRAFT_822342 [Mycena albidolilacea]|uniref:Uncharacterized protein n=1 Tax=Mycena albidolilacea TaxID=1033008 RepID=A0AAD7ECB4_9AGAR|nr:hypothetical protein DFH08DRAFT_822342 [Mycena albidolilacea]
MGTSMALESIEINATDKECSRLPKDHPARGPAICHTPPLLLMPHLCETKFIRQAQFDPNHIGKKGRDNESSEAHLWKGLLPTMLAMDVLLEASLVLPVHGYRPYPHIQGDGQGSDLENRKQTYDGPLMARAETEVERHWQIISGSLARGGHVGHSGNHCSSFNYTLSIRNSLESDLRAKIIALGGNSALFEMMNARRVDGGD